MKVCDSLEHCNLLLESLLSVKENGLKLQTLFFPFQSQTFLQSAAPLNTKYRLSSHALTQK